ncbi:MAG: hypothetical protein ACREAU_06100 [Nitrosopumilaceae archaeon]
MTKEQAKLIVEAHEIKFLVEDEEEVMILTEHNPTLFEAYKALINFANS